MTKIPSINTKIVNTIDCSFLLKRGKFKVVLLLKIDIFLRPMLKIERFLRTQKTYANGTTGLGEETEECKLNDLDSWLVSNTVQTHVAS